MTSSAIVLDQATSELGEGPLFDPSTGTAWWFNIKAANCMRCIWQAVRRACSPEPDGKRDRAG